MYISTKHIHELKQAMTDPEGASEHAKNRNYGNSGFIEILNDYQLTYPNDLSC